MTKAERFAQSVVVGVREFVSKSLMERDRRLDALEAQQAKSLADMYRGGYQPNNHYARGDVANYRNSLWLCMSDTSEPPGSTSDWRLILKGAR